MLIHGSLDTGAFSNHLPCTISVNFNASPGPCGPTTPCWWQPASPFATNWQNKWPTKRATNAHKCLKTWKSDLSTTFHHTIFFFFNLPYFHPSFNGSHLLIVSTFYLIILSLLLQSLTLLLLFLLSFPPFLPHPLFPCLLHNPPFPIPPILSRILHPFHFPSLFYFTPSFIPLYPVFSLILPPSTVRYCPTIYPPSPILFLSFFLSSVPTFISSVCFFLFRTSHSSFLLFLSSYSMPSCLSFLSFFHPSFL